MKTVLSVYTLYEHCLYVLQYTGSKGNRFQETRYITLSLHTGFISSLLGWVQSPHTPLPFPFPVLRFGGETLTQNDLLPWKLRKGEK